MPRIRSVKPEVATHEGLFDLEQATNLPIRFAWVMLWTVCDREGRFRWRPRMLKADVLPFDAVDFGQVLDALAGAGFIQRYEANGQTYGCIPTWRDHQKVNSRESASQLPEPPSVTPQASASACVRVQARVEGDREGDRDRELEREGERETPPAPVVVEYLPGQIRAGVGGLVGAWNNLVASVPQLKARAVTVGETNPKVYSALKAHPDIDWWAGVFAKVATSDLLRGLSAWRNGDVKATDFFWVLRNADEIAAGQYDNPRGPTSKRSAPPPAAPEWLAHCPHRPPCVLVTQCAEAWAWLKAQTAEPLEVA
jgi:hypothetical protein